MARLLGCAAFGTMLGGFLVAIGACWVFQFGSDTLAHF